MSLGTFMRRAALAASHPNNHPIHFFNNPNLATQAAALGQVFGKLKHPLFKFVRTSQSLVPVFIQDDVTGSAATCPATFGQNALHARLQSGLHQGQAGCGSNPHTFSVFSDEDDLDHLRSSGDISINYLMQVAYT